MSAAAVALYTYRLGIFVRPKVHCLIPDDDALYTLYNVDLGPSGL